MEQEASVRITGPVRTLILLPHLRYGNMRLLNARTHKLEEFPGRVPQYAILSHTWGLEEVSFKDLTSNPKVESMQGYKKIRFACHQTLEYGLIYVWCDTCCK